MRNCISVRITFKLFLYTVEHAQDPLSFRSDDYLEDKRGDYQNCSVL